MATTIYWSLGKVVWQTPNTEASWNISTVNTSKYKAWSMDT